MFEIIVYVVAALFIVYIALIAYKSIGKQNITSNMLIASFRETKEPETNQWTEEMFTFFNRFNSSGIMCATVLSVNKDGIIEYFTVKMLTNSTIAILLNSKIIATSSFEPSGDIAIGKQLKAFILKFSKKRGNNNLSWVCSSREAT